MSKQVRILFGSAIMLLGYSPIIVDVVSKGSGSRILDQSIDGVVEVSGGKSDAAVVVGDAFPVELAESNVVGNLMQNIMMYGDFGDLILANESHVSPSSESTEVTESKPKASSVKIVSRGEFVGARLVKGEIQSNFYVDARRLGVPADVVDGVIGNLSQKIDFRRSLKVGDRFEILYSPKNEMLYARIMTKRSKAAVYRFNSGTSAAYYFENGQKVCFDRGSSFGSPLTRGLRVSSSYGYRRHPISGRWMNHTGVDFMAAYGAPVQAVFDGIVTRASYYYGYGHCVDIKHRSGYSSRYAHLSGYNVRCGAYVKKGQIIGRVGSSGTSTGSHLHLELARNNKTINPLSIKMMPSEGGVVPNLRQFNARKKQIDFLFSKQ